MGGHLSSREVLLTALSCGRPERIPCCFMSFRVLRNRCRDWFEVAERELEMGLDAMLFVPPAERHERLDHPDLRGLPMRIHPEVVISEWKEKTPEKPYPILHKRYETPAGILETAVQQTEDWPHGDHIPIVDDYQIARSLKSLVENSHDLEALPYLLTSPQASDIELFRQRARQALAFTQQKGLLSCGGWGVGADLVGWLCGLEKMVFLAVDEPEFLHALFEMIAGWNRQRMAVILEAGVDLYVRRGWYESCQFWSPALYRRFLLPHLKRDVEMAHQAGSKFGYIVTTATTPLLDFYVDAGIDVLIGVDPAPAAKNNLQTMRQKLQGKVCLWGGVNAAQTVELGTPEEVRMAVGFAMENLGPDGFILSPVDNITEDHPKTWANLHVLIDTWQQLSRG